MANYEAPNQYPELTLEIFQQKLAKYKEQFPEALNILQAGGVHPENTEPMLNPYLDNEPDTEDFRNIGQHCIAVAYAAEQIAKILRLQEGLITADQEKHIIERALVHDANKRVEIMRRKAQQAGRLTEAYSVEAYEHIGQVLQQQGVDPQIADYIINAGKETGHNSSPQFIKLDTNSQIHLNPQLTIAEMLVHIADDMTHSMPPHMLTQDQQFLARFMPVEDRMNYCLFPQRYPWLYKKGFGFQPDSTVQFFEDINDPQQTNGLLHPRTYATWQVHITTDICKMLQQNIDPRNKQDPNLFIADLINHDLR